MIYTIYPQLDTTIYESSANKNTGIDSIIELSHTSIVSNSTASAYNSRILLKFDVSDIESKVTSGLITNPTHYLSLRTAAVKEIPFEYNVYAYPISSSWYNGTGRYFNTPLTTDGASWRYRSSKVVGVEWDIPPTISEYEWDEMSSIWVDADVLFGVNLSINVTSSYCTVEGGGTWWNYDGLECTQSFSYQSSDLYMNVTQIVQKWITGSGRLANDGMILKFGDEFECLNQSITSLKFFATDSNTIYVPRLHTIWDDSAFSTGSLTPVDFDNMNVDVKTQKSYSQDAKAKIYVNAYEQFPQKLYTTQSYYTKKFYLPTSSYYEIRDAHTDEVVIPFDDIGTKISCDSTGNYFNLWMSSFQPERFYRVLVKTATDGGNRTEYFDSKYYFKVSR